MRARANSAIALPPRLQEDVHAILEEVLPGTPSKTYISVDLTGWPYLERFGLSSHEAMHQLPPYLRHFVLRTVPPGSLPGDTQGYYKGDTDPVQVIVSAPSSRAKPDVLFAQIAADHEMRHMAQHLLSSLSGAPAGFAPGTVITQRSRKEARYADEIKEMYEALATGSWRGAPITERHAEAMANAIQMRELGLADPWLVQSWRRDEFGLSQVAGSDASHALDPVEFYTNLGTLVDQLEWRFRFRCRGANAYSSEPIAASEEACFREQFVLLLSTDPKVQALRQRSPKLFRKLSAEVYAQAHARLEGL